MLAVYNFLPRYDINVPTPQNIKTKRVVEKKGKKPLEYYIYPDPSYHEHVDQLYSSSQRSSKRSCTHLSQSSPNQSSKKTSFKKQQS